MKNIKLQRQSGGSLIVVVSVLATLMVVVGIAAEYTNTVNRHVQRSNTMHGAVSIGQSEHRLSIMPGSAIIAACRY